MYEEGTIITERLYSGKIIPIDEDTENAMYDYLCERLDVAGFIHYEVSNFALPGYKSKHNSNYWNGTPYIGIGAGAHSYLPPVRSWNPDNLDSYIHNIQMGTLQREQEILTEKDLYNEKIMLGLRTSNGIDSRKIRADYATILDFTRNNLLKETSSGQIIATQKGIHILNRIIEQLI